MEIRILGRDLEVSEIGFGCMGMSHAYGTVSTQKEAEELIVKQSIVAAHFLIQQRYTDNRRPSSQ